MCSIVQAQRRLRQSPRIAKALSDAAACDLTTLEAMVGYLGEPAGAASSPSSASRVGLTGQAALQGAICLF